MIPIKKVLLAYCISQAPIGRVKFLPNTSPCVPKVFAFVSLSHLSAHKDGNDHAETLRLVERLSCLSNTQQVNMMIQTRTYDYPNSLGCIFYRDGLPLELATIYQISDPYMAVLDGGQTALRLHFDR